MQTCGLFISIPDSAVCLSISLHCSFGLTDFQAIHSVTIASHQAEFVHHDPLAHINISTPQDCHTYPELKRKLYSALTEGDQGELSIAIPKEVSLRQSGHAGHPMTNGVISEGEHPVPVLFLLNLRQRNNSCDPRTTNTRPFTNTSSRTRVHAYRRPYRV